MPSQNVKKVIGATVLAASVLATGALMTSQGGNCGCGYGKCGCLEVTLPPYNPFTPFPTATPLITPTLPSTSTAIAFITKVPTFTPQPIATLFPLNPTPAPNATPTYLPIPTQRPTATNFPTKPALPTDPPRRTSTPIPTAPLVTPFVTNTPPPTITSVPVQANCYGGFPDPFSGNSTIVTAAPILVNVPVIGSSNIFTNQDDWYSVPLVAGNTYRITLAQCDGDFSLYVVNSVNVVVALSINPGNIPETIVYTPASSGTYYVYVNFPNAGFQPLSSDYLLKVEFP